MVISAVRRIHWAYAFLIRLRIDTDLQPPVVSEHNMSRTVRIPHPARSGKTRGSVSHGEFPKVVQGHVLLFDCDHLRIQLHQALHWVLLVAPSRSYQMAAILDRNVGSVCLSSSYTISITLYPFVRVQSCAASNGRRSAALQQGIVWKHQATNFQQIGLASLRKTFSC